MAKDDTRRTAGLAADGTGRTKVRAFSSGAYTAVHQLMRNGICVSPDASLETTLGLLLDRNLSTLPVADGGRLLGVITLSDLARVRSGEPSPAHVENLMLACPLAVTDAASIAFAAGAMASAELDEIPVVDMGGTVVGILRAREILRWLALEHGIPVAGKEEDEP